VKPIVLNMAQTGTVGIGRELGSDEITLRSEQGVQTIGSLHDALDKTLDFPNGWVTVGGRFTYRWSGTGTVSYFRRDEPARVHGAPGGYGHVEDRLYVRHVEGPREFAAGETIAEGELRVLMLP